MNNVEWIEQQIVFNLRIYVYINGLSDSYATSHDEPGKKFNFVYIEHMH